jgi:hypothetical protein
MTPKRESQPRPNPQEGQPHDSDREERQPYAKELDDYAHGVANPPEEQGQEMSGASRDDRRIMTRPDQNQPMPIPEPDVVRPPTPKETPEPDVPSGLPQPDPDVILPPEPEVTTLPRPEEIPPKQPG